MPYEQFDHTADVGVKAWGEGLEEAVREIARGMFDVITDIDTVDAVEEKVVEVESDSLEMLVVDFLSELVFVFEVEGMVFSDFKIEIHEDDSYRLIARCFGEKMDLQKHPQGSAIKAVSYHEIEVDRDGRVRIIFDV